MQIEGGEHRIALGLAGIDQHADMASERATPRIFHSYVLREGDRAALLLEQQHPVDYLRLCYRPTETHAGREYLRERAGAYHAGFSVEGVEGGGQRAVGGGIIVEIAVGVVLYNHEVIASSN